MREDLFAYQLTPPYFSLWMCSWSCRVRSQLHFDHANHPKRSIHQVEWIVVSANLYHQPTNSVTLKHNRMNIAEYSIVKYDWLQLRKVCDFKPINQSNQSVRRISNRRSIAHPFQWTGEKGDCSLQRKDNPWKNRIQSERIWVWDNSLSEMIHHSVYYSRCHHRSWHMWNNPLQQLHSPILSARSNTFAFSKHLFPITMCVNE